MPLKETLAALFLEMCNPGVIIISFVTWLFIMKLAFMNSSNKK